VAEGLAGVRPAPLVDGLILRAIAERTFPGAVVLIARPSALIHYAAYGTTAYDAEGSHPTTTDTIYDIASLTKVVTATAALRLWERGVIELERSVASYIPALKARAVTVRHLLTHTSGLDLRLSAAARGGAEALRTAIYAAPLRQQPGASVAYTNINSLLLGDLVAECWGGTLDLALHDLVLAPLEMRETCFSPGAALRPRIAPTEIDEGWRGGVVQGTVHDESAHALGGVAGHAGLFSTAADLWRFCAAWLSPGLLRAETIAVATSNQTVGLELACGLGWMLNRPAFMGAAPAGTYGHTGFTGPAIVVLPDANLLVIVLSNRTFPQRGAPTHHAITAAIVGAAHALG
jgi:serine-type D-Ala-D-Ala carboxypeptidase